MARIPTSDLQRQQSEPPSVVALIRAGHPGKAVALSIIWRMPWRSFAAMVVSLGVGVRYAETLQHLRFW